MTRKTFSPSIHSGQYVKCESCRSRSCMDCMDKMAASLQEALLSLNKQPLHSPVWDAVLSRAWHTPEKSYGCLGTCRKERCLVWTKQCPCCLDQDLPDGKGRTSQAYKSSSADIDDPLLFNVDVPPVTLNGCDGPPRPFVVEVVRAYQICSSEQSAHWFRAAHYSALEHGQVTIYHSPSPGTDCRLLLGMGCLRGECKPYTSGHCLSLTLFNALSVISSPPSLSLKGIGEDLRLAAPVRNDGRTRENMRKSQLTGRRGQDAPPLHESSFRARRSGGSAGIATGSLASWRAMFSDSRLEGALPRRVLWLVPLVDDSTESCTELLPVYMSPKEPSAVALTQLRFPPRGGSDVTGSQVQSLFKDSGDSSTGVSVFLKDFTSHTLTAARILVALAELDKSLHTSSTVHASAMLARFEQCREVMRAADPAASCLPPTTRRTTTAAGSSAALPVAEPPLTDPMAIGALSLYASAHHITSVYTPLAGHIDHFEHNVPGLESKATLALGRGTPIHLCQNGMQGELPPGALLYASYKIATLLSGLAMAQDKRRHSGDVELHDLRQPGDWHLMRQLCDSLPSLNDERERNSLPWLCIRRPHCRTSGKRKHALVPADAAIELVSAARGVWVRNENAFYAAGISICDHSAKSK